MTLPTWLRIVITVGEEILAMDPKTAAIAGPVLDAITGMEMALGDGTGAQKKAGALQAAADAVASINNQTGNTTLPPAETVAATSSAIDTIVTVANLIAAKHAASASTAAVQLPLNAAAAGA